MFQGRLMGVSMKYQGCFMQVSWIGSFKGVSRKFQKLFKGVEKYLPIFENFLKISLTSDSPTRPDYIRPNWEQS